MSGADEFDLIARYFAPLASSAGARGLLDDAAVIETGGALVVTTDAIVEGVHFLARDPIDTVAQKALRVNLSDIAAKGGAAFGYLLTLQWPDNRSADEIALFAAGLARDQAAFGVALLGGDTVRTPGPLAVSVTMFARAGVRTPDRAGARVGHDLWVTGTIGDGVLGLMACRGNSALSASPALSERYRRPTPRTGFAQAIARYATASMDVSDGLLGDAAKLAAASGVALRVDPVAIPLSREASAWLGAQADRDAALSRLAGGGDDYELLFTAGPADRAPLEAAAAGIGLQLTWIGAAHAGEGVSAGGLAVGGHAHRLGVSTSR